MNTKRFKIAGLIALSLVLMVTMAACDTAETPVDEDVTAEYNVNVAVVDEDGGAVEGATVELGDLDETTDAQGAVTFDDVKEGDYALAVTKDGYTANSEDVGTVTVDADNTSFSVEMIADEEPAEELTVESVAATTDGDVTTVTADVLNAEEGATATVEIYANGDTTAEAYATETDVAITDNAITTDFNDVPAGTHTAVVTVGDVSAEADFTIEEDPGVESVAFENYRHIQVIYNTEVDLETAGELDNYYININEGNAAYNAVDLGDSNRLSELAKEGQALGLEIDINAENVDGKTVVDIYFPENARFTLEEDNEETDDAERTLKVQYAGGDSSDSDLKSLVQGENIALAVRNVETASNQLSIDTTVHEFVIRDEDNPEADTITLTNDYDSENAGADIGFGGEVDRTIPSGEDTNDANDDQGNNALIKFDEPVFDAHDLEHGNGEFKNVRIYVDGTEIATTTGTEPELSEVMNFNMDADTTYDEAKEVTVLIKKLLAKYADTKSSLELEELYQVGESYNVTITGVRDLAGNNMERSEINFTINLVDDDPSQDEGEGDEETTDTFNQFLPPEVEEVKQVADNIFRIKFVTGEQDNYEGDETSGQALENVTATFTISGANYDEGKIIRNVPLSNADGYSYVQVPAIDEEQSNDSNSLSYGENDTIERDITISNPWRVADLDDEEVFVSEGENLTLENFVMKKDISAPEHEEFSTDDQYYLRDEITTDDAENPTDVADVDDDQRTIVFEVEDVVPDTIPTDAHFKNPVIPVLYEYDADADKILTNNAVSWLPGERDDVDVEGTLLPVVVSYTNPETGITHESVVTNKDDSRSKNSESITFETYEDSDGVNRYRFKINLTGYDDLIDSNNGRLVDGVEYSVKVPSGFFADAPRDVEFDDEDDEGGFGDYVGEGVEASSDSDYPLLTFTDNNYEETFNEDVGFVSPRFSGNVLSDLNAEDIRSTVFDPTTEYNETYDVQFVAKQRPKPNYGFTNEEFEFDFEIPFDYIEGDEGDEGSEGETPDNDEDNPEDEVPQTTKELVEYIDTQNTIEVKFTGGIDASTLKDPANYTISGDTLEELGYTSDDIKYLVRDIPEGESEESDTSDGQYSIAQFKVPEGTVAVDGTNVNFTVANVANRYGAKMTPLRTQLELLDNTRPVPEAELIGEQEIKLRFKETVNYREQADAETAASNFVVKYADQTIRVDKAEIIDAPNNIITLHFDSIYYNGEDLSVDQIDTDLLSVEVRKDSNDSVLVVDDAKLKNPLKLGEYPVSK